MIECVCVSRSGGDGLDVWSGWMEC